MHRVTGRELSRLNRMEGCVVECDGARAVISALQSPDGGASQDYWAVGRLITVRVGASRIVGHIHAIDTDGAWNPTASNLLRIRIELQGEIRAGADGTERFFSGIETYPYMGAIAHRIRSDDLAAIYAADSGGTIRVGNLTQDSTIPALVAVDKLLSRHFAVVGTTGVGKSTALSLLLRAIMMARPEVRILLLDPHNEFAAAFPEQAVAISAGSLELPYWIFQFDELADVLYRGQPPVAGEIEQLRELIPMARESYFNETSGYRLRRLRRPDGCACTIDTPLPYRISDMLRLIGEREGMLDGKAERPHLRSLRSRLESIAADPRFRFMFQAQGPGDRFAQILANLFRAPSLGRPITIIDLSGLPSEVINAVVSVLGRLAFDLAAASDGAIPTLLVCEEAHRYIPSDPVAGFRPTRTAIARIAREGRKHGAFLAVVSQRPGELDPTVLSQCSTIFSMRLGNACDKDIIVQASTGAARSTLSFLSSLADREAIAFGEAVAAPMRMRFDTVERDGLPCAHDPIVSGAEQASANALLIDEAVRRLRRQDLSRTAFQPHLLSHADRQGGMPIS